MSSLHQVRILARNGECALVSLRQCRLPPAPSIKRNTLLVPSTVYRTSSHFSLKESTKKDTISRGLHDRSQDPTYGSSEGGLKTT
jgi:hypothetical protein